MKVCTDACLFGALIPILPTIENVLDIGTGTGLLSLMLAQKVSYHNIQIDALEIEEGAYRQAKDNFNQSAFNNKINILHLDFFHYQPNKKYDVLVCNPPFYKQQYPTKNNADILARHNDTFDFNSFFIRCYEISKTEADLFILMPYYRKEEIQQFASKNNWNTRKIYTIKNRIYQTPIRCVFYFTKKQIFSLEEAELIIYTEENQYTANFKSLLQDYYWGE